MDNYAKFRFYYILAAKGIQNFILRSDKLRLMIGGSDLIERLPGQFLRQILDELHFKEQSDYLLLSQAAGAARLLFREEAQARALARLFPLALSHYAPGLDVVQTVVKVGNDLAQTMRQAEESLNVRRNLLFPSFPVPGPLVLRCPRSGLPAVGWLKMKDGQEPADATMAAQNSSVPSAKSGLTAKILPQNGATPGLRLPENLDDLVPGEKSTIALVHIDCNGLGKAVGRFLEGLNNLSFEEVADRYSAFSQAVERATVTAVQEALAPLVQAAENSGQQFYPFRPLVCAGDDVTIILRASGALGFVENYLKAFENSSLHELAPLGFQNPLTASAGIAYVNKHFPFSQAYDLCESLCKYAKDKTNRTVSAVAFWRLTTTMASEFGDIVRQELTLPDGLLTMMPYVTGSGIPNGTHPGIASLRALQDAVNRMPRGSLRGLLGDLYQSRAKAQQGFERIAEVAGRRESRSKGAGVHLNALQQALADITGTEPGTRSLFTRPDDPPGMAATPLHDVIELIAAEGE